MLYSSCGVSCLIYEYFWSLIEFITNTKTCDVLNYCNPNPKNEKKNMLFFCGLTTCDIHYVYDDTADNRSVSKGITTVHFVKFINELLDIMIVMKILKEIILSWIIFLINTGRWYKKLKVKATKSCTSPLIHQNSTPSNSFGQ